MCKRTWQSVTSDLAFQDTCTYQQEALYGMPIKHVRNEMPAVTHRENEASPSLVNFWSMCWGHALECLDTTSSHSLVQIPAFEMVVTCSQYLHVSDKSDLALLVAATTKSS